MTDKATQDVHLQMFGCPIEEIQAFISTSLFEPTLLAVSVLSDAQELIALGNNEKARQHINIAKQLITHKQHRRP